jgi:hypothetical protein
MYISIPLDLHEIIKLAEADRSNTRDARGLLDALRAFPEDVQEESAIGDLDGMGLPSSIGDPPK